METIGKGAFGVVYLYGDAKTGNELAIKREMKVRMYVCIHIICIVCMYI